MAEKSRSEFRWAVLFERLGFWPSTLRQMIGIGPLMGVAGYFAYKASYNQTVWDPIELLIFFGALIVGFGALMNWGIYKVMQKLPPHVVSYKVNDEGVWIDTKQWTWERISQIQDEVEERELPKEEWFKEVETQGTSSKKVKRARLSLVIEAGDDDIHLLFDDEVTRQEFIAFFKHGLKRAKG